MTTKQEHELMRKALLKQRKEVTASKEAAEKFLKDAGIWHLLVPKSTDKKLSAKR